MQVLLFVNIVWNRKWHAHTLAR